MVDTAMTHTTDTGAQEVVVQEWTFERIQEAVKKVAHNVPPYKGTQAVTAFQAEQLMGMVRNELQQTIATLTALPKELSDSIIRRDATIATQAAQVSELEADNERLRAELAAAQRAITELQAASAAGEWRPVADGCYEDVVVDDDGARLVIWVNQEHGDESVKLQPNIRLCEYIGSQSEDES